MLITDKFVMLNFPKTGSTFTREAIKQVYDVNNLWFNNIIYKLGIYTPDIFELLLPKIDEGAYNGIIDQHGKYKQIPKEHKNKPIISIVRNPFSRIVSSYFFKWWQNNLPTDKKSILKFHPNFPDLSFDEYYIYYNQFYSINHLHGIKPKIEIGTLSLFFIQFYAKDPEKLISELDNDYFNSDRYVKDFEHIQFIHQEDLRFELKSLLKAYGLPSTKINIIDDIEIINKTKYPTKISNFMDIYSDELIKTILSHEKLLFKLFPEYLP